MNKEEFERLLGKSEDTDLDWKEKFPDEISPQAASGVREKGRAILVKDLASIANGASEALGYLIYGVKDRGGAETCWEYLGVGMMPIFSSGPLPTLNLRPNFFIPNISRMAGPGLAFSKSIATGTFPAS